MVETMQVSVLLLTGCRSNTACMQVGPTINYSFMLICATGEQSLLVLVAYFSRWAP